MNREHKNHIDAAAMLLCGMGAREVFLFGSATMDRLCDDSEVDIAVTGLPHPLFFKASCLVSDIFTRPLAIIDLDEENPLTRYLREEGDMIRVA